MNGKSDELLDALIRGHEGYEHQEIPMSTYREVKSFPWLYVLICVAIFGAGFILGYGTVWDIFEPELAWSLCR